MHRSVLLPGARVEEGATVCDSVLGPRSLVRPGAVVEAGSVLGDDVVVEAGQRVSGTKIPEG